eukprot:gene3850-13911_t
MATKVLPTRSTRGKRIAADDEDDGEFWNQEFFAEEQADHDFDEQDEEPAEDIVDSDFDDEEDDDDEEGEEIVEKRKKTIRPPGWVAPVKKKVPAPKLKAAVKAEQEDEEDEGDDMDEEEWIAPVVEAPTLRTSTKRRTEEAENERKIKEKKKPKRQSLKNSDQWRPYTQGELLAEAARTEIDNLYSLKLMLAREEEAKRRAQIVKKKYTGPSVKHRSVKNEGEEKTTFQVCNATEMPAWMAPKVAPRKPKQPVCVATGTPALYRDPKTKQPYANAFAYTLISATSRGQEAAPQGLAAAAQGPVLRPNELSSEMMSLVVDLHASLANERRQLWLYQNRQSSRRKHLFAQTLRQLRLYWPEKKLCARLFSPNLDELEGVRLALRLLTTLVLTSANQGLLIIDAHVMGAAAASRRPKAQPSKALGSSEATVAP